MRTAGRASYEGLLEAGVRIFEYGPTMLHAKTLCIDRRVVVGRLGQLRQPLVRAQRRGDPVRAARAVAQRLTEVFEDDLEVSEAFDLRRWRRRPLHQRAAETTLKLARREL